mmetsp:Transcript_7040/g.29997  ORF Transcript_7040/g.29997 Transcript_7040/m.29997 type:complete len:218 (+) Transcript_7040:1402-2055(+)
MPSTSSSRSLCAATANDMSDACISRRSRASNCGCASTTAATHSRNFNSASASANASASSGASIAACVKRSMSDAKTSPARTEGLSFGTAPRSVSSVLRWKSSGNTCVTASIRYGCAMSSLHCTTCSRTRGNTTSRYRERSNPSSDERTCRFFPTKSRSSRRSFSRRSTSRAGPPCCMRTHSLFISVKFCSTKSTASRVSPPSPSNGEPASGRSVLLA